MDNLVFGNIDNDLDWQAERDHPFSNFFKILGMGLSSTLLLQKPY
jgi:hypothetical protein